MKSTDSKYIANVQIVQGQTVWHYSSIFNSLQLNTDMPHTPTSANFL